MDRTEELSRLNGFPVYSILDRRYRNYGRVITALDVADLINCSKTQTGIPAEGNVYVPSFPPFEELPVTMQIRDVCFGGLPLQAGYCNGRNTTFNGFEYHKVPEINVAVSEFCLALGHSWEISTGLTYDVSQAEVFYVPQGTVFEIYGTTLHLSPLRTLEEGFRDIVILPRGTNTPLSEDERAAASAAFAGGEKEARLLLQKHKWVISHPERAPLMKQAAHPGVTGINTELKYRASTGGVEK